MLKIVETENLEHIYAYQMRFSSPYFFSPDFSAWRASFTDDVDGEGRTLFKALSVKSAYEDGELLGFIQYGHSAFGFGEDGSISSDISYPIIRNFYFNDGREDAGTQLLRSALDCFGTFDRVYAFFHYFGMSCFARHGKLFEQHAHIGAFLKANGFLVEHENVYYSSALKAESPSEIELIPHGLTEGNQQYFDFLQTGNHVGGCEVHFLNETIAYLRWIYVNEDRTGRGIGTKCMNALKDWLSKNGMTQFDTDTALTNQAAQHFYEKTASPGKASHEAITGINPQIACNPAHSPVY